MIPSSSTPEFIELWSDKTRYNTWLEVELVALEAMERSDLVPVGTTRKIREMNLQLDPRRIEEIEQTTKHDIIAFLTHVEELGGPPAKWLHLGMTSSDVVDTSFAIQLVRATDMIATQIDMLINALADKATKHRHTLMVGRTHGMHAEPVTFGIVMAGHCAEMQRAKNRLLFAKNEIAAGKISGATGMYSCLPPIVEMDALDALQLKPETVATQVVARDRHAMFFCTLGVIAAGVERLATNIRHWQRTEVGEAREAFSVGQKGSSAMPHKCNPVLSENLCGLARVVRSAIIPAIENIALWHERDISHSSVERIIAPDTTSILSFILKRATKLVESLVIYPDKMRQNLESTDSIFSGPVLLALVKKGMERQQAYKLVQTVALGDKGGSFQERVMRDSDIRSLLSDVELLECFDLEHAVRYADLLVNRLQFGSFLSEWS